MPNNNKIKPKYETKNCPRCGKGFECKSDSILLCQCQTVVLSLEQLEYISERYDDCLCATCLRTLRDQFNALDMSKYEGKCFSLVRK